MKTDQFSSLIKDFLLPIISVAVMLVLGLFVLFPKIGEIFSLSAETKTQSEKISSLSQKLADLQTLSEGELFDSANLLLEALPVQKDFYKVLNVIKKSASDNNVLLESFNLTAGVVSTSSSSPTDNQSIKFSLTFSSSFSDLKGFLKSVDNSLPIIFVDSLKLSSPVSSISAGMQVEGKMTLSSFIEPLPKTLPSANKPLAKISSQNIDLIEKLRSYSISPKEEFSQESVIIGKDNPF